MSPKDALCQVWLKSAHAVILEKNMKMWKAYRQTDDKQQTIKKSHLRFQIR